MTESGTLEDLSREECLDLLGQYQVGRVAVGRGDQSPLVVPVNYVLDGEVIVFRSDPGSKIYEIRRGPASFQVDQIDALRHTGWSVLVQGIAYEATGHEVRCVTVEPWVAGPKDRWVRLVPRTISGRRIVLPAAASGPDGYL